MNIIIINVTLSTERGHAIKIFHFRPQKVTVSISFGGSSFFNVFKK